MVVKDEPEKSRLHYKFVELGEANIKENVSSEQIQLEVGLRKSGVELIDDKKSMLIEKIKNRIVEMDSLYPRSKNYNWTLTDFFILMVPH